MKVMSESLTEVLVYLDWNILPSLLPSVSDVIRKRPVLRSQWQSYSIAKSVTNEKVIYVHDSQNVTVQCPSILQRRS